MNKIIFHLKKLEKNPNQTKEKEKTRIKTEIDE
jgi:hypothetical protein